MSWSSQHILTSDTLFPVSSIYIAEADVVAATGKLAWIYWLKNDALTTVVMRFCLAAVQ